MILATIQSSIVLLITLCAVRVMRLQSAGVRHAIWTMGLCAALVMPLVPSWRTAAPEISHGLNGLNGFESVQSVQSVADFKEPTPVLPFVWGSGFAIAGIFLLAGIARLAWLTFRAQPISSEPWTTAIANVSLGLRLKRKIRLLQNSGTLGTWGILRGRIFLPQGAEAWSEERIQVVLAHELAHVKRCDWMIQVVAEAARAFYWFNPLFWIACKQLRRESEHACDDAVLNLGIDGQTYATHLLELARSLKHSDRAWAPVLAMARPPHLERRFAAMLNPSLNRLPATVLTFALATIAALTLALPLAAMREPEPVVAAPPVISPTLMPPPATPAAPAKPIAPRRAVAAQGRADGSLSGTVSDPSGAVIPGVSVTVSTVQNIGRDGIQEIPVQTVIAGAAGDYYFAALTPGSYSLKAELPGFVTYRRTGLQITSSQTLTANIALQIGNIAERVVVSAAGQPKPQAFPVQPRRIRVGGVIVAANLISQVKPNYPQSARDRGAEGTVVLEGIIGTDGSITGLRSMRGADSELTNAAREAVMQWKYRPTMLNGSPVEVVTTIEVVFELQQ